MRWKMTHLPRLCVESADNCNNSYPTNLFLRFKAGRALGKRLKIVFFN